MDKKGLILHVSCLQALVLAMMARMAKTDLEGLREILDNPVIRDPETAPELAHYSPRDRQRMKKQMIEITGLVRAVVLKPASRA